MSSKTPLLILLAGFQGSGKTTLAQKLVNKYGLILISPDKIRQQLFDRGVKFSEDFANLVDQTRDELIKKAVSAGISVVVDTNMVPERIEKIKKDLAGQNYKLLTIFLDTPQGILAERVTRRPQIEGVYRGTPNELTASLTAHGDIKKDNYDLVIDTGKSSPNKTFQTAVKTIIVCLKK